MSIHQAVHQLVNDQVVAPTGHVAATGAIFASLFGLLTPALTTVATVLAIAWYAITIYETQTVQRFLADLRSKK